MCRDGFCVSRMPFSSIENCYAIDRGDTRRSSNSIPSPTSIPTACAPAHTIQTRVPAQRGGGFFRTTKQPHDVGNTRRVAAALFPDLYSLPRRQPRTIARRATLGEVTLSMMTVHHLTTRRHSLACHICRSVIRHPTPHTGTHLPKLELPLARLISTLSAHNRSHVPPSIVCGHSAQGMQEAGP